MEYDNPLPIILGIVMANRRKGLDYHALDVARHLNLSHSAYRMIEAGGANLQGKHTLPLAKLLSFDWKLLAEWVVAIQVVDESSSSITMLKDIIEDLCIVIPECESVLNFTDSIWESLENRARNVATKAHLKNQLIPSANTLEVLLLSSYSITERKEEIIQQLQLLCTRFLEEIVER